MTMPITMNSARRVLSGSAMAVLLLGLSACGTVNTTTSRGEPSADAVEVRQDINDVLSNLAIHATEVRMFESPSGALQAQVDIANDGFRTRRFAYRFDWVDGRGNVIDSRNAVWRNASIPAGGSAVISSTALTREAADFKLQVRRSN